MLLLSDGTDGSMGSALMLRVEEAALQLYRRPYLAWGVPERTLILLHALLKGKQQSGVQISFIKAVQHHHVSSILRAAAYEGEGIMRAGYWMLTARHQLSSTL